ncbi:CAMK family protein kinase [Elysia marginata]|uniref:CAMK family protein kinase n=1 Tax=Elysia marginata TaxID=1093978 RepID=A0AAV4JKH7_9GAST|nr:CAMK family protein kinase [Elysia marginata]
MPSREKSNSSESISPGTNTSNSGDEPELPRLAWEKSPESGELYVLKSFETHVPTVSEIISDIKKKIGIKVGPRVDSSNAGAISLARIRHKNFARCMNGKDERRLDIILSVAEPNPQNGNDTERRSNSVEEIVYAPSVSDISSDCPSEEEDEKENRDEEKRLIKDNCNELEDLPPSTAIPLQSPLLASETTEKNLDVEDSRQNILHRLFLNKVCNLGSARCTHVKLCTYKGTYINHAVAKFYSKNSPKFDREVEALTRLRHSSILKMITSISYSDQSVVLLAYCNHGNLATHIGKLNLFEIVNHFYKICSAVRYMHLKNFIHGDIKLENILIDMIYEPILSDFDLSERLAPGNYNITGSRGTVGFMAPEMYFKHKKSYDGFKTDTYSLGAVLLCMLFETKLRAQTNLEALIKIAQWPDMDIANILRKMLRNMVKNSPERRWDTADIFMHFKLNFNELEDLLDKKAQKDFDQMLNYI